MDFKSLVKTSKIKEIKFQPWEHILNPANYDETLMEAEAINQLGGGIYRMYDENNEIIYVGKSLDVHRRLMQHIGHRSNTYYFIDEVKKIEYYRDDNPIMQTMLEGIFIAYHTPKYNHEVIDAAHLQPKGE